MSTFLMIVGIFFTSYALIMLGTVKGSEYPRKREVSRSYDIVKTTISTILAIVFLLWSLIAGTGWEWPW